MKHLPNQKVFNQHFTPDDMVKELIALLPQDALSLANVLEPSCGDGQILKALLDYEVCNVTGVDIDLDLIFDLECELCDDRVTLIHSDFLKLDV